MSEPVQPNEEELAALAHIDAAVEQILKWKPRANSTELIHGVHTVQQFVIQHMLQRLGGPSWGHWYDENGPGDAK